MITFNMVAKINESKLIWLTKKEAAKRIELLAFEVEAEAKRICSTSGGRSGPPQEKGKRYYYAEPINDWVNSSPEGGPPYTQVGNLKGSIKKEAVEGSEKMSWRIGPSVIYGKWLEFGTRNMKERPFMRPALAAVYTKFASYFKGLF